MSTNSAKQKYIRVISFFVFLTVLFGVWAAVNCYKAQKYKLQLEVTKQRAMSELCENLDSMSIVLEKELYSSSPQMLESLSSKLSRNAACAKVSLSALTDETMITDEIYKFLSQAGDFSIFLAQKAQKDESLSAQDRQSVSRILEYSKTLAQSLGEIRDGYYDGSVDFEKGLSNLSLDGNEDFALFSDSVSDAQQSFGDYPTLIYDGPFADSVLEKEPQLTKGKDQITADEARKLAAKLLEKESSSLRRDDDEISKIELYCFSSGEKAVGITKRGGYLCYLTNPEFAGEATIGEKEAIKRAGKFLEENGFSSMQETYYSTADGVCTVNFAYRENGVVYYADLIKISVRLDTGKVCAADARGYIMNHSQRNLPKAEISLKEAKENLSENLIYLSGKKALIPLENGKEKLCYELHCKNEGGQEYLVYVDVQTGQEDNILLLLYADGGTLTK